MKKNRKAITAVVAQIAEANPKARKVAAKSSVSDRYLRQLEDEGLSGRFGENDAAFARGYRTALRV